MSEHRIEITDSRGTSLKILVRLPLSGQATWRALDQGHLCYGSGVADTGHYPTNPMAWIALYGGNEIDDSKMVLHLDDFLAFTDINRAGGEGHVYQRDYLLMEPGKVNWQPVA